ncbi:MAG TPA: GNAT family N-acetyltransferase [Rhizomicrobium sp.]|jgi:RimJ/RimL family protein N-acetyltransferase
MMLETERLILRPPVEADFDQWVAFDADARATRFFGGPKNRADSWELLSSVAGMWALRGCGLFSVFEKASGEWIGRIGPWKPEGATAEIGWAVLPSHWGKGYATEGARAAIDWAVDHLGWAEIAHCIDADNAPSIAVAHRLGAKWLREARDSHGGPTQVYGQSAQDWRARR